MDEESITPDDTQQREFRFRLRYNDDVKSRKITATEFLRQFSQEESFNNDNDSCSSSTSSSFNETDNLNNNNRNENINDTSINDEKFYNNNNTNINNNNNSNNNNSIKENEIIDDLSQVIEKTPPNTQRTYDSQVDTIPLNSKSKWNILLEFITRLILFGYKVKHEPDTWNQIIWRLTTSILDILLISGFSALWSYIFILPYCGFLFQCGCTWPWKGGADHCNVNNPNLSQHEKCPFCAGNPVLIWIFVLLGHGCAMITVSIFLGSLSWRVWLRKKRESVFYEPGFAKPLLQKNYQVLPFQKNDSKLRTQVTIRHDKKLQFITWWILISVILRLIIGIITFFVYGFFVALIFKWAYHYPKFVL